MSPDNASALTWAILGIIILVVHFIPSFIAFSRQNPNRLIILILNILIGWTIVGWVILLVWADKKN